jgi:hypothetical protein
MIYNNVAEIFEGIDETRNKLKTRISGFSEEQENARPANAETGWSVAEIVEHLATVESGVVRIISRLLAQAETAGIKSDGALNPPVSFVEQGKSATAQKFQAPERVHPKGKQSLAESLVKFDENRRALLEMRPRIEAVDSRNTAFPHPIFGNLNLYEWLVMIGMHEARHLQQIEAILEANKS